MGGATLSKRKSPKSKVLELFVILDTALGRERLQIKLTALRASQLHLTHVPSGTCRD